MTRRRTRRQETLEHDRARTQLKVCFIQPEGGAVGADPARTGDDVATRERVDNVRVTLVAAAAPAGRRAAVEKFKLWEIGRTLRCRYLDGDPSVQAKVDGDRQGVGGRRQPARWSS